VSRIDPFDESLDRWVVEHYSYDSERHERRNRPIVAFDDPDEMVAFIDAASTELKERQRQGQADQRERYSGVRRVAGYEASSSRERLAGRLRRHHQRPEG
jgi:hypothetical protein